VRQKANGLFSARQLLSEISRRKSEIRLYPNQQLKISLIT
jgi:hypothetical protein